MFGVRICKDGWVKVMCTILRDVCKMYYAMSNENTELYMKICNWFDGSEWKIFRSSKSRCINIKL